MSPSSSRALLCVACACAGALFPGVACAQWAGYAGNAQHTALSTTASQSLDTIKWQTPVDLDPQFSGDELFIHYGSPMITAANTVIVPVKTGAAGGFELQAFNGANGAPLWTQSTDYALPPSGSPWPGYNWTPSYSPTITPTGTLDYAGSGGTIYSRSALNSPGTVTPVQTAFYGTSNYAAFKSFFDSNVAISTPITSDAQGDIFFGYETSGATLPTTINNSNILTNGIARISSTGVGTFFQAQDLVANGVNAGMNQVVMNAAPALSNDGNTLYVAMSSGNFGNGRLVALNSATLAPTNSVALLDPQFPGQNAPLPNISTASPMVGPDGDVYMGVYDVAGSNRGWMEHFNADLTITKPTGAFGWDSTASVVPASMVPSYHGTSAYLIMTKYNNYTETGGDGVNMLAILDPNDTQPNRFDSTGEPVMKEVLTIAGPTPDSPFDLENPNAVREWCINTAVVDPATDSVLANNEDGKLYRWNLATNTLTQVITLTPGLGEAYTPTLIGPDGTVYAINDATLFAVGVPEPASLAILVGGFAALLMRRRVV